MSDGALSMLIVALCLASFLVGFIFSGFLVAQDWYKRLLKRKLIQFNPQTGELEWMDGTKV